MNNQSSTQCNEYANFDSWLKEKLTVTQYDQFVKDLPERLGVSTSTAYNYRTRPIEKLALSVKMCLEQFIISLNYENVRSTEVLFSTSKKTA